MFDTLRFRPDPLLQGDVLVASFATARELRTQLRGLHWRIESSPAHLDDQVTVSPKLHGELSAFLENLASLSN